MAFVSCNCGPLSVQLRPYFDALDAAQRPTCNKHINVESAPPLKGLVPIIWHLRVESGHTKKDVHKKVITTLEKTYVFVTKNTTTFQ